MKEYEIGDYCSDDNLVYKIVGNTEDSIVVTPVFDSEGRYNPNGEIDEISKADSEEFSKIDKPKKPISRKVQKRLEHLQIEARIISDRIVKNPFVSTLIATMITVGLLIQYSNPTTSSVLFLLGGLGIAIVTSHWFNHWKSNL